MNKSNFPTFCGWWQCECFAVCGDETLRHWDTGHRAVYNEMSAQDEKVCVKQREKPFPWKAPGCSCMLNSFYQIGVKKKSEKQENRDG